MYKKQVITSVYNILSQNRKMEMKDIKKQLIISTCKKYVDNI